MKCSRNITESIPRATIEYIASSPSTNRAIDRSAPHGHCLMCHTQTAGRGQRTHTWEAAPGLNITMSLMLRPDAMKAADQFRISMAVALGITDTLTALGIDGVEIKWPNDIYVGEGKICGILIENALTGPYVARSIAGIGLNVNQTVFTSDAPNPISLRQLTGRTYDLTALAQQTADNILRRLTLADNYPQYLALLRHRTGQWPWRLPDGSVIHTSLATVTPQGALLLTGHPTPILHPTDNG